MWEWHLGANESLLSLLPWPMATKNSTKYQPTRRSSSVRSASTHLPPGVLIYCAWQRSNCSILSKSFLGLFCRSRRTFLTSHEGYIKVPSHILPLPVVDITLDLLPPCLASAPIWPSFHPSIRDLKWHIQERPRISLVHLSSILYI